MKATYQSARGPVTSEWKKVDQSFELHVVVPFGAEATVYIPAKEAAHVTEGGQPAAQVEGVHFQRMDHGAAVFGVGGGSYDFVSP